MRCWGTFSHWRLDMEFKGSSAIEEFSSLVKEESPRGTVIVCAAFFDETLGQLLNDTRKKSFFERITDARDFGLLTCDEHDDLHSLRELRNHFAHDLRAKGFDSAASTKVDNFKIWKCASSALSRYAELFPRPDDRIAYVSAVIAFRLQKRSKIAIKPGPLSEPPLTDTSAWPPAIARDNQ